MPRRSFLELIRTPVRWPEPYQVHDAPASVGEWLPLTDALALEAMMTANQVRQRIRMGALETQRCRGRGGRPQWFIQRASWERFVAAQREKLERGDLRHVVCGGAPPPRRTPGRRRSPPTIGR